MLLALGSPHYALACAAERRKDPAAPRTTTVV